VNDGLGHDAGDELLRAVGERLQRAVRDRDLVARYGGDEFAVLCTGVRRPAVAARVAERIVAALASPILVRGQALRVGISVGVALSPVRDRASAAQLLASADAAMYTAKAGGNGWSHARPTRGVPAPLKPSAR
jgi:diguanylate cyclase (GGDEF)-like protein